MYRSVCTASGRCLISSFVIASGPRALPYGALVVALTYWVRVMYVSRVISGCDVVWCGVVEGLCRSCPGFVAVSIGPLGVVRVLHFVVLFYSVLLRCL